MGQRHSKSHNRHAEGSLTKYQKLKGRITRDTATPAKRRNARENPNPTEIEAHCTIMPAATQQNHTASSLTSLSAPVLTRILQFSDPVSQESLRRTCHILYSLPEPDVTDPLSDSEDPFADPAPAPGTVTDMEISPAFQHQPGSPTQGQGHSLCQACITARESPTYADRVTKATKYTHCARCKADHPRCLFSRLQRDSTKIPQSIRYCIGHEGVLRLCEHKAVSWLQIVNMSKEILAHKVGRRWKVIRCKHEDHLLSSSDVSGGSEFGGASKERGFRRAVKDMTGKGYPSLTVGFKDSSKDFCLTLEWEGHITLDMKASTADESGLENAEVGTALRENLKMIRGLQGRYICPAPEPGLKIEEMVLGGLIADRWDCLDPDHGKERGKKTGKGKVLTEPQKDSSQLQPAVPSKVETTTEVESVRSSLSSTQLVHIPPIAEEDTNSDVSVDNPTKMKSLVVKHGKLSGSVKVTWGLGMESDADWVPVQAKEGANHHFHNREKKQHEDAMHAHHEPEKPPRNAITDSFKMRPCRTNKLKRHICHDNKDEVCLKVKYSRRIYIGDSIHGATVRNFVGFRNWISVLDPGSYKLTEDDEGFGVYWCCGTVDADREGHDTEGLVHKEENERGTVSTSVENGMHLDIHLTGKSLDTGRPRCRNYYAHIKSRTEGLKLAAGDYTRSCKKGSNERHAVKV
ncbi:hypothetical protein V8F06_009198 [Rhypophila decipiens]